jgi:hypothetical protein
MGQRGEERDIEVGFSFSHSQSSFNQGASGGYISSSTRFKHI